MIEDQAWDPSRLPGPEWAGEMLGTFPPILHSWRVPCLPPLLPLHHLLPCPYDSRGQRAPWKVEDQAGEPSRLPGACLGGGNASCIPSLILRSLRVPPHLPLLFFPPVSPTPPGSTWPEGAPEGRGPGLGPQQASQGPIGQGKC